MTAHTLHEHPERVAVCRLPVGAGAPDWATSRPSPMVSLSYTADETSLVCAADAVPSRVTHQGPFTALSVVGPLDFSLVGVLAELLRPIADAGVSAFTVSTYDTDWILVPSGRAREAVEALRRRGHVVTPRPSDSTS